MPSQVISKLLFQLKRSDLPLANKANRTEGWDHSIPLQILIIDIIRFRFRRILNITGLTILVIVD